MRATAAAQPDTLLRGRTGGQGGQGETAMPDSEDFARLTDPFRAELLA